VQSHGINDRELHEGEMKSSKRSGPLVIIGGAEDKEEDGTILKSFVRLAGGKKSNIVVIAVASDSPSQVGKHYVQVFKRLGAGKATLLNISAREDANAPAAVGAINNATAVFFTGGTQLRITQLLGGTTLDTALHNAHENGLVLAGTSAGAAMMSSVMIIGSIPGASFRMGNVELGPGMEFISGVLIDQHFEQRGRLRRLLSAIAQYPRDLGIGIDENTAAIVRDGVMEVVGEGCITIVDAGGLTFTNIKELEKNEILTLCGIQVHILANGYQFDLRNRCPVIETATKQGRGKME
jgi:cyanophycinase